MAHTAPPMLDKRIPLIVHLIAAWFDNASAVSTHMPVNSWRNAYDNIVKLLNVMSENPTYILKEQEDELNEAYNPKGLTDTIMVCTRRSGRVWCGVWFNWLRLVLVTNSIRVCSARVVPISLMVRPIAHQRQTPYEWT